MLGDEEVGLGHLPVKEGVHAEQVPPRDHADEERRHKEEQERKEVSDEGAVVEAGHGLAHGVDAVGEGQPGVERPEELRLHLDGVEAGGARDLKHHEKHAERLAHVLERDGQGVDHKDVDE